MQYNNVLSLLRRMTAVGLGVIATALPLPTLAETTDSFPLISLLSSSSLQESTASNAEDSLAIHEIRTAPLLASNIDLTMDPDSLWDSIRNGFAMNNLNDDLVLYYQQWYQNRPDALRRMVERSRPYLHHIVHEIESRGMPTELALLPMVESSFNPMAYSRSHASGLWQFIPATGKRFKLEQNWWRDQRRDIVASTGAALEYLQTIYDMHGDWHLALASYNWGEGAVKRAIEKNVARNLPTDYASLNMPNETRHYVPKLQALKNIFGNPALMARLDLPEIPNRPYFATIETDRLIDVKTAARFADMPVEQFIALNPSHNRPVIKADTAVIIPADRLETFQSNLENNTTSLTEWQAYTLKRGEKIDQVAPRFGITLGDLLRVNGLHGKIRLATGSTLLVPAGRGADDLSLYQNAPELPQIIEPEPIMKSHARGDKRDKFAKSPDKSGKKVESKQAAQRNERSKIAGKLPAGKLASRTAGKGNEKMTNTGTDKTRKVAATKSTPPAKSATPAKVAKASNGKRS